MATKKVAIKKINGLPLADIEVREMLKSRKQLNEFYHTKITMMRKEMRGGNEQESIFTY